MTQPMAKPLLMLPLAAWLGTAFAPVPAPAQSAAPVAPNGPALYQTHCARCHNAGVERAPNRAALQQMPAESLRVALVSGSMSRMSFGLTAAQIAAIAESLTGKTLPQASQETTPQPALCTAAGAAWDDPFAKPFWNGWGVNLGQHRFQPAAMAQLPADRVPNLKLKWAFAFPGASRAWAQPTVVGGRVFTGSAGRKVYSLDAKTGCTYWTFEAEAPVRTAITIGPLAGEWAAYFGDQHGTAYAVNALTGKLLWKTRAEDHAAAIITGAPTLAAGRLYVPMSSAEEVFGANPKYECCKFRGSLSALDAATGAVVWKTYTIAESPRPIRKNQQGVQLWGPSGAGIWSSPAVDLKKRAVYVTTGDSYSDPAAATSDAFLAFEMDTGKLLWSRQMTANDAFTVDCASAVKTNCPEAKGPDFDFGSSPMLVDLPGGRRALIAGQKSGMVHAVDPDQQGEVLWQVRAGKGSVLGGVQWGSAVDGENVYVAVSDLGFAPRPATGGMALNPKAGGGMFAFNTATGKQVWQTPAPGCADRPGCSPAQSAAVTAIPGVVFSGSLDGHLRAYATGSGRIVWDIDTVREYQTANGVKGNGGSIDGPGPVIVGGMLFTNSGYGAFGGAPGNVLLAFSID
jgi:polyvinyl alcohol dehydrogenase (cytochrome)